MKKCPICKTKFTPTFSSLQKACSVTCAIQLGKTKIKVTKNREWKAKKKVLKEKNKTLGDYKSEARTIFQRFIRLRDKNQPCISCGKRFSEDEKIDAGHIYKAELYSALIFDEENVHSQCVYCNHRLSGNLDGCLRNLPNRIGQDNALKLTERANNSLHVEVKRTKLDYEQIINDYKQKIKEYLG